MSRTLAILSHVHALAAAAVGKDRGTSTCSADQGESCTSVGGSVMSKDSMLLQFSTLVHDGMGALEAHAASAEACYGELDALAEDEGAEIGVQWTNSLDKCKQSCSDNAACKSMSFCPGWHGCWLKDKAFNGGEANRGKADCKTYFKKACVIAPTPSPTPPPTPAPTPAPTAAPTPAPTAEQTKGGEVCYGELAGLAEIEGEGVGEERTTDPLKCQQRCASNADCNSVSFCPQWNGCWMKDRTLSGTEAVVSKGECKTMYKKPCDGKSTPVAPPAPTGDKLRVVTYNLWWWKAFRERPQQGEQIVNNINKNLNADVLGLQECDSPDHIMSRTNYEAASPFQGAQGVMARSGMFTVGDTGSQDIEATGKWGPRYVTWAQLTHKSSGRTFWHFNTHWCVHNGNGRTCGADKRYVGAKNMLNIIQEKARGQPVIITGDFNANMQEPGPLHFLSNGFSLAHVSWVDAVFYSTAHWKSVYTAIGDRSGSDHAPVIAELEFI